MGANSCALCKEQTLGGRGERASATEDYPRNRQSKPHSGGRGSKSPDSAPRSPGRQQRERKKDKQDKQEKPDASEAHHGGQRRADLQVKSGGFALKNFMPTNPGTLEDAIEVAKTKLGEGGFGAVRQGKDKRTGVQCAVKSIRKNGKMELLKMREEIEIMKLLDHPNIIRFMETFEDRVCIYLVMELCNGGELFDRISQAGSLSEAVGSHCVWQMLLAVNYLHQNYITHRDMKPENWLVSSKQDIKQASLKLIDFGISKRFEPGVHLKTRAGTPNYVAPEVLAGRYDEKADIWSLGVILYVMLSGSHPFSGRKIEQVLQQVKLARITMDGSAWRKVSTEAKSLVRVLLQKSVATRPPAKQALQHAWFETHDTGHADVACTDLEVRGLQAFGRMNQLKRAVLTVIATQLSQEAIEELNAIFMAMDHNSDGTLSIKELRKGLEEAAINLPCDINTLLEQVDTDGSGVVDYTEFLAATMDKKVYHQENVVWNAFKKFDLDNSGAIDRKELHQVLGDDEVVKTMHLEGECRDKLQKVFEQVDSNGDGLIDFDEFFRMMRTAERAAASTKTGERNDIGIACQDMTVGLTGSVKKEAPFLSKSTSVFLH